MASDNRTELKQSAEQYWAEMNSQFQKDTRDWERFAGEVPEKFIQLVKSGIRPNISRGSGMSSDGHRTLSVNLSFESNMDAAKEYLQTLKTEIPRRGEAFCKPLDDFDEQLEKYYHAELGGDTFEKLAKLFAQWVDYAQNLHVQIRDTKITVDLLEKYLLKKKRWTELADQQKMKEDAQRYGIPVEDVPKHRSYLAAKQKKITAKTSAAMNQAIKLLQDLNGYMDSEELILAAQEQALQMKQREEEQERIRKAEEEKRQKEEAERERIRKEKEAVEKAQAERIAKQKAKEAKEMAQKMRSRFQAGAGMIACSMHHCVALKPDGTVIAVGENRDGQCNVSGWRNVVAVDCDNNGTVGLTAAGTVLYAGSTFHHQAQCTRWNNIKAITMSDACVYGLRYDGTVAATVEGANGAHFSTQPDVTTWRDIVTLRAEAGHVLGIRKNGEIVAISRNYYGRCEEDYYLNGKKNAEDAAFGYLACGVILHKDGKCSSSGTHYSYVVSPNKINEHQGIVRVHMIGSRPVAILADGTLVVEPNEAKNGQDNFLSFIKGNRLNKNVVAITGNLSMCAILTVDGRIFTYSRNELGSLKNGQPFGDDFRLFENFHKLMDGREAEAERIRLEKEAEEKARAEKEALQAERRNKCVCQHCGGEFKKVLFGYKCIACGTRKDY